MLGSAEHRGSTYRLRLLQAQVSLEKALSDQKKVSEASQVGPEPPKPKRNTLARGRRRVPERLALFCSRSLCPHELMTRHRQSVLGYSTVEGGSSSGIRAPIGMPLFRGAAFLLSRLLRAAWDFGSTERRS